MTSTPIKIS